MPIQEFYEQVRQLAEEHFPGQQNRFAILHTPVLRPSILLVGNRPAKRAAPDLDEEAGIPEVNLIFSEIPYMFIARAFFNDIERHDVLGSIQSTDIHFFRQANQQLNNQWEGLFGALVEILQPTGIVAVGPTAKKKLCRMTPLGEVGEFNGIPVAPVVHFSGVTAAKPNTISLSKQGLQSLLANLN